ncbi:hypothetical protein [Alicyclobacillus fructus]|uniref:hypothetical protein n=1 Tax=Alicyclobacillus fructus TaxID=2816082 RepID=UPI001A90BE57|nr:hypothetical protein [Alicyclobacillus fructus]
MNGEHEILSPRVMNSSGVQLLTYLGFSMVRSDTSWRSPVLLYGPGVHRWRKLLKSLFGQHMQEFTFQEFSKPKKGQLHPRYAIYWVSGVTDSLLRRFCATHPTDHLYTYLWLRSRVWFAAESITPNEECSRYVTFVRVEDLESEKRLELSSEALSLIARLALQAYRDVKAMELSRR